MPSTLKHSLHKDSLKVLEVYMQALTTVFQDEAALFLEKKNHPIAREIPQINNPKSISLTAH